MPPPTPPTPPLGVRYCLAIQKTNVELFQISQRGFPFSSIPSDANKALRDPFQKRPLLPAEGWVPAIGVQSTARLFARWWLCFPTADGNGHGHEGAKHQETLFETAVATVTLLSPAGRADVAERYCVLGLSFKMAAAPFPSPILIDVL